MLALWLPGQDVPPHDGVAFKLPAGAQIGVRIHYKKTWQFEGKPLTDRSTVGVYFAKAGATAGAEQELLALPIDSPPRRRAARIRRSASAARWRKTCRRSRSAPTSVPGNISLQVEAVRPDGSRVPMIRLNTRADWDRRYWFEKPMTLPRGTRVEVTANLQDPGHALGGVHLHARRHRRPGPRRRDAPDAERDPGAREAHCAVAR